jgi:hypothetical protein
LGEHRLQHREHRLGGLGGRRIANEVSKLFTASVNRAHVPAKVVHEDFGRVGTALHHLAFVLAITFLVFALEIVLEHVKETLHDADIVNRGVAIHCLVFHDDPLEKSTTLVTAATGLIGPAESRHNRSRKRIVAAVVCRQNFRISVIALRHNRSHGHWLPHARSALVCLLHFAEHTGQEVIRACLLRRLCLLAH